MYYPECYDTRPCCFRDNGRCRVLNETYENDGECRFAKPGRQVKPYSMTDEQKRIKKA